MGHPEGLCLDFGSGRSGIRAGASGPRKDLTPPPLGPFGTFLRGFARAVEQWSFTEWSRNLAMPQSLLYRAFRIP